MLLQICDAWISRRFLYHSHPPPPPLPHHLSRDMCVACAGCSEQMRTAGVIVNFVFKVSWGFIFVSRDGRREILDGRRRRRRRRQGAHESFFQSIRHLQLLMKSISVGFGCWLLLCRHSLTSTAFPHMLHGDSSLDLFIKKIAVGFGCWLLLHLIVTP